MTVLLQLALIVIVILAGGYTIWELIDELRRNWRR